MCLQFIKNTLHVPSLTDLGPISVAFLRTVCDGAFTVHDDLILALVYTFLSCHIYLDRKHYKTKSASGTDTSILQVNNTVIICMARYIIS